MRLNLGFSRLTATTHNSVLDALFPPRCAGCQTWVQGESWRHNPFCADCQRHNLAPQPPLCERCGASVPAPADTCPECDDGSWPPVLKRVRALGIYEEPWREGLHRFKYGGQWSLAEGMGAQLAAWCRNQPPGIAPLPIGSLALIVPIPMHPWRQWRRGYNQSALLAGHLSRHLRVPTAELLRRTRYTPPQVSMNGDARRSNMRGAFAVREREYARWKHVLSQPVLLLDDVFTTGTTLRECAQTLHRAGAREIYALALARAGENA